MTIPFLDFIKKKMVKGEPVTTVSSAPATIEKAKPNSERLSKTVLPNATRNVRPQDSFQLANPSSEAARRPYSSGKGGDLPPAVALAIEPKVERVIALELSEVATQIPSGWVRPISEAEACRRVLLKAAEIEKGMSSGRPTVSIASIYRQIPEIFVRPVPESDTTQVTLPFKKVLEQFKNLHLRGDQYRDQSVPQIETPFLKVTLEDNSKFGIETGPVEVGELPPVRVQPATAENLAAAEPEWATREKLQVPQPAPIAVPPADTAPPAPPAPTRIPFKLSPTGPDAPASESVPASSGRSVPTGAASAARPRIPFQMGAPNGEKLKEPEQWLTKDNFEHAPEPRPAVEPPREIASEPTKSEIKISLPLKAVLQNLPPFQVTGDVNAVPKDARFELPFSLIEKQLASGRVSVNPDEFAAALPEKYKNLFSSKEIAAPVALLLQDVLQNLPAASLRMRDDQVEQEKGGDFATPFSAKAEEDAKRFHVGSAIPAKRLKGMTASKPKSEPAVPAPIIARDPLQAALGTDHEVDAKAVVAHIEKMAGVKACAIIFADGLSLAGTLPDEYEAEGLCAMAPSLLEKVGSHLSETKLGPLRAMTLSCKGAAVTFFMHDNLCLAALHAKEELATEVREQLASVMHELSKKYSPTSV